MPSASIRPPALVRSQSSWSIAGAHYKHWATSLGNFSVTPFFGGNLTLSAAFSLFFAWLSIFFFPPLYVTSDGFELRYMIFLASSFIVFFPCFHNSVIFWFAQYCLSKIPLLCIRESDKAPTNKIYCCASSEQHPPTRSCHESECLV